MPTRHSQVQRRACSWCPERKAIQLEANGHTEAQTDTKQEGCSKVRRRVSALDAMSRFGPNATLSGAYPVPSAYNGRGRDLAQQPIRHEELRLLTPAARPGFALNVLFHSSEPDAYS